MQLTILKEHKLRTGTRSLFAFTTKGGSLLDPDNLVKRVFEPTLRAAGIERHISASTISATPTLRS